MLGTIDIRSADGRDLGAVLLQPKRVAVLFHLAVARPRGFHRRESLLTYLWPEMDDERARAGLRRALHFLRAAMGRDVITGRGDDEIGLAGELLSCDVWTFESLLDAGQLEQALALYGGDLLASFHLSDVPEWERWLEIERARIRRRALDAAITLSRGFLGTDTGRAVEWARRAAGLATADEGAVRQLIEALDADGDRAGALNVYEEFAAHLTAEYAAEPSAETQAAIARVRRRSEPVARPSGPAIIAMTTAAASVAATTATTVAATPVTTTVTPVRRVRRSIGAVALLTLAIVAGWVSTRNQAEALPLERERIVILPFTVRGGPEYAYLKEGMVDLLSANIDGAGALRAVDVHALLDYLRDAQMQTLDIDAGRRVARRFGAGRFVIGSIVATGDQLQLSASLYDADGERRATAVGSSIGEAGLVGATDEITRGLVRGGLSGSGDQMGHDAAATTTSVAALKAFLEGEQEFRGGRYESAVSAFQRAVAHDSTFALALYRLSTAANWAARPDIVLDAEQRAMLYIDRLPARDQQLLRAHNANSQGQSGEAERLFRAAVRARPDALDGWTQLGEVIFHSGPWRGEPIEESRSAFELVLSLRSSDVNARIHLARLAALGGESAVVDSMVSQALAIGPDRAPALELAALRAFTRSDAGPAARAAERAAPDSLARYVSAAPAYDNDVWLAAWRVGTFTGNPAAGRSIAALLTDPGAPPRVRLLGYTAAAHMEAAAGHVRAMRADLAAASALDPLYAAEVGASLGTMGAFPVSKSEAGALALRLAAARLTAGQSTAARGSTAGHDPADVHDRLTSGRDDMLDVRLPYMQGLLALEAELARHFEHQLRARILLARGDTAQALATIERGWPIGSPHAGIPIFQGETYTQASERFLRAKLLAATGRPAEAFRWYATLVEDLGFGIALQAPAAFEQARLYEATGDRSRAIEEYARLVALWAGADRELQPTVSIARGRLKELMTTR